jgi:hypothetical protein
MLKMQFPNADGNLYKPEGNGANWVNYIQDAFEKKKSS